MVQFLDLMRGITKKTEEDSNYSSKKLHNWLARQRWAHLLKKYDNDGYAIIIVISNF